jgi:hypothetical protein
MSLRRVYVAGPIGPADDGRRGRMGTAAAVGIALVQAGLAPFVPHLWGLGCEAAFDAASYEDWIAYDLAWLATCHALLRIPGHSPGADREVQHARDIGIPVFGSVEEVLAWASSQQDDTECPECGHLASDHRPQMTGGTCGAIRRCPCRRKP